jgi:hypothetical protein
MAWYLVQHWNNFTLPLPVPLTSLDFGIPAVKQTNKFGCYHTIGPDSHFLTVLFYGSELYALNLWSACVYTEQRSRLIRMVISLLITVQRRHSRDE